MLSNQKSRLRFQLVLVSAILSLLTQPIWVQRNRGWGRAAGLRCRRRLFSLASKITQRRFVFTAKSCASIRTTRSLTIIWALPKGMMGNKTAEIREYQRAEALGLRNWDLFLNLGLAQLENGDLDAATDSLRRAVLLGEKHSESHFNLALVDERRGMLADAEHETLVSLRLNPGQPDARNLLGVIYAQEGKTVRAS